MTVSSFVSSNTLVYLDYSLTGESITYGAPYMQNGIHSDLFFDLWFVPNPCSNCNPSPSGTYEIGIGLFASTLGYGKGYVSCNSITGAPMVVNGTTYNNIAWACTNNGNPYFDAYYPYNGYNYEDIVYPAGTFTISLSALIGQIQYQIGIPNNYYLNGIEIGTEFGDSSTTNLSGFGWSMSQFQLNVQSANEWVIVV